MKDKLKLKLKRHPKFYNLAKRDYSIFHSMYYKLGMCLLGTRLKEKYWVTRSLCKGNDWRNEKKDWIRDYWDSHNHSHRSFLVEIISKFSPSSILELGCNCGPNLYLLAKKFPDVEIIGIDINPMAVESGNEWFKQAGILNVKLLVGKADELEQFKDRSFDVVFTDAVLIYIGPDKIKKIVKEMVRITRKAIILVEWNDFGSKKKYKKTLGTYYNSLWKRDYAILLKEIVPEGEINVTKITGNMWADKNWKKVGAIIEVVMDTTSVEVV